MNTAQREMAMKVLRSLVIPLLCAIWFCAQIAWCSDNKESLTIGLADMVHVKVLEASELEQSARVTDSGEIPLILGGNVKIAGLSPADAALAIEQVLKDRNYVLNPHVTVTIDQYATQTVSVVGQVHAPGVYPIGTPRTIVDVLAIAGGINDAADRKVTIQRRGTKEQTVYFLSNQSDTALNTNVEVFPGDIVMVPKAEIVYILGDVARPGGFPMVTNDSKLSVLQALSFAGGTLPSAVPSKARMIRKQPDGKYIEIDLPLSAMQKGKSSDIQLQADDIIYVPFSYLRNMGMSLGGMISAAASASIYRF
jgi:polysaccharide export outer membrane protein